MQLFWGKDEFGAREEIGRIAREKNLSVRWVDKEALALKPLGQWVDEGAGGLFGKSLVVGLDPAGWLKGDQEQLAELAGQGLALLLVWQRGDFDKRAGWFAKLKKAGKAREWPELSASQLQQWVEAYAVAAGGSMGRGAAAELVARAGSNRWRLQHELDKLLVNDGVIEVARVRGELAEASAEAEIFAMLDALAAGNRRAAVGRLSALLESGESEFYVLSMLGYQLRTLLMIREAQEAGQGEKQAASSLGLHPFVVQKNWRAAQRWSRGQLVGLMTRLLATDAAIKRGAVEARLAVTMVVVGATAKQ